MIYNGNNEIDKIYYGDNEIGSVWYGNNEVWTNNKIIKLNSGQTFDITQVYSDYANLTTANFYYLELEDVSGTDSVTYPGYTVYLTLTGSLTKTYTNGIFTSEHYINGSKKNTTPVIVPDPSKLVSIGTGKTFDIKTLYPDTYQNLTANNFIVNIPSSQSFLYRGSITSAGTYSCGGTHKLVKSYDSTTGTLTCKTTWWYQTSFGQTGTYEYDTEVYFVKKAL